MPRSFLSTMLITAGLCLLLVGLGSRLGATPARAQQPPPRPTLTPSPTTAPKSQPAPQAEAESVPAAGLITGTVIDQTTGAPVAGVAVAVGGVTVATDANGNYGLGGLPAGNYSVALVLTAEQGAPAQGPLTVELPAEATVVKHLAYRRPPPVPATAPAALPATGSRAGGWGAPVLGVGLLVLGLVLRGRGHL